MDSPAPAIRDFTEALAPHFRDIDLEWIEDMYRVEQTDRDVLDHPREPIVDPGGAILFVEAAGPGVIGTCALQRTGDRRFELTKMGVAKAARGLKAGEFLLRAAIARAHELGAERLYLLSTASRIAAIHLYETLSHLGLLWLQGQNDAIAQPTADSYGPAPIAFKKESRKALPEDGSAPFFVSPVEHNKNWPWASVVRSAQTDLGNRQKHYFTVETTDLPLGTDGFHYGPDSVIRLARRMNPVL